MHRNLINHIKNNNSSLTTFLNPYSYLIIRRSGIPYEKFNWMLDGFILVVLFRLIGIKRTRESFDMTSLAPKIFHVAGEKTSSVYFIGGEEGVAEMAVRIIKDNFPSLNVSGYKSGFFNDTASRSKAIKKIVLLRPDIVVAGMGTPYQEQFLLDLVDAGWDGEGYTCGGFLHQTAQNGIQYYPGWIDKYNLRWLYRMYDEPKLIKRYFIYYPWFVIVFVYDVIRYKLGMYK